MSRLIKLLTLSLLTGTAVAQSSKPATNALPPYTPQQHLQQQELMHSWGEPQMASLMSAWERGFEKQQPAIRFVDTLKGTETAQAALFAHVADLAVMGREILMLERHVMFRREHHLPLEIMVASGSYDVEPKSSALAVFVNKSNPLQHLTLDQLDGIFGDQRTGAWDDKFIWHPEFARTADKNIRTWGQLGLTGEWANKPIHVFGYPVTIYSPTSGPMMSFRKIAFHGGDIWNPDLQEYPEGSGITAAMKDDPYAIGYTCICDRTPALKPVALADTPAGPFVDITKATVTARTYPLSRAVYIYIDRDDNKPVDPKVKEFLTYVLSREGQQAVAADGGYLPLPAALAQEQLRKLQ